ncbi:MAG: hypothetical protein ACLP5H_19360 [Desulfomonilaceae bacterium]
MWPKETYLEVQLKLYDLFENQPVPTPALPEELLRFQRELDEFWVDIDFSRKVLQGWVDLLMFRLYLRLAPLLFEWLKWILMLATIKVVDIKSGSTMVHFMVGIFSLALIFYFAAFFGRIRVKGLTFLKSEKWHTIVSVIIGMLLGYGVNQCALALAEAVATMSK